MLFKTTGKAILFIGTLLFTVSLIVIPLWYVSTTYPTLYGLLIMGVFTLAVLVPLFLRLFTTVHRTSKKELGRRAWIRLKKIAFFLLIVLATIGGIRFYQAGNPYLAAVLSFLVLFLVGLGLSRYDETR
ncbi:MAG: hypothetical protein Kow009_12770 [Spirochaetales bacterium]